MKKFLFTVITALFGIGNAVADEFVVSDITIPRGGSATIEIGLNNPDTESRGFQFIMSFDKAVTASHPVRGARINMVEQNEYLYSLASHSTTEGFQVLAYTTSTVSITGTTGTVASITLTADGSLDVGTTVTGTLSACTISNTGGITTPLNDVTFTVTIGEPDDGRIKFDETSTTLPVYTAGEKGNVRMKRTINAGEWSTIVLPFTLTKAKAEAAFGSDVQLAEFSGFSTEYTDEDDMTPDAITLNFTTYTMTAKKGMTGGKPFLIKTTRDITEIEADDATLFAAVEDDVKSDNYETSGKMTGTFVKTKVPANGLFLSGNQFWYSVGETNIKAFRAWFELGAVLDKETDFGSKIRFYIEDEIVGIQEMRGGDVEGVKLGWYTLDGRKLDGKPTEKGVYLVDGKKVAIY